MMIVARSVSLLAVSSEKNEDRRYNCERPLLPSQAVSAVGVSIWCLYNYVSSINNYKFALY